MAKQRERRAMPAPIFWHRLLWPCLGPIFGVLPLPGSVSKVSETGPFFLFISQMGEMKMLEV